MPKQLMGTRLYIIHNYIELCFLFSHWQIHRVTGNIRYIYMQLNPDASTILQLFPKLAQPRTREITVILYEHIRDLTGFYPMPIMMSKGCKQLCLATNQCRALFKKCSKKNGRARSRRLSTLPWKLSSMFGHSGIYLKTTNF